MKLNQLNLQQALTGLKKRLFSSQELVQACLDQIQAKDKYLHAFLTLNADALQEARAADQDKSAKPLKGIPYALKDNFLTAGIRTTASAKLLDKFIPPYESTVSARLKAAGAILLGKTNMDAWAHGSSTETSDYGPTHNPWNLNHLPGGSSGGSAAAVSADMCTFAIGSETAGSIRQPAAWCGITGFKPTYGRVSRYGLIAMASSTDSPGPLTKTVTDSAIILKVIAGYDRFDSTTSSLPVDISLPNLTSLKGLVLGLPQEYLIKEMKQPVKKIILAAIEKLKSLGAKIQLISLLDPHYAVGVYTIVSRSEVSSNLARYDGVRFGHNRLAFTHEAKNRAMLGAHTLSSGYYDQYYHKAQKVRKLMVDQFQQTFNKINLIVGPVSPGPALKLGASFDDPMFGDFQDILVEASALSGLTSISVPCGFVDHLPIGLQLTGPQFAELKVLQAAYAYQQATDWHLKKPNLNYD